MTGGIDELKCRKSTKTTPGAPKNDPKTTKKAIPNDKTKQGPNQDDLWIVLDQPQGVQPQFGVTPGVPFGRPKRHQTRSQNDQKSKRKIKTNKNRSKTILDPSWGDLGPSWVPSWADLDPKIVLSPRAALVFLKKHFSDVKTIRRRSWDQLWPTKALKGPKMTPKTEPKSTPRRSKIDVKIVIKNNAKSKRAQPLLVRRHWAGTLPQGPPGRRLRDPGEAAQAPWDL